MDLDLAAADPFIKVEPEPEPEPCVFGSDHSMGSTIVVAHPEVKLEPETDPYEYEPENSMFPIVTDAHPTLGVEPGMASHEPPAENATITTADPMIKFEQEPDPSDAGPQLDSKMEGVEATTEPQIDSKMEGVEATADPIVKLEHDADAYEAGSKSRSSPQSDITIKLSLPQTVRVLNIGLTKDKKLVRMKEKGRSILTLCRNARGGIAPNRAEEMEKRFADAALYLDWLDTTMEMTPNIKFVTKVDMVLRDLANTENIPAELANRARELYDRYEAENWGEDTVIDEDPETPTVGTITPTGVSTNGGDTIGVIELPAANDPIFGQHGIMYGIIVDTSGKGKTYRLRADIPRKPTKIYGHNGLTVGAWFPFQINALFWGAHGARMGGIAGSVTTGAWSIVVASAYDDLDSDHGDTLYYSGSNSHTNENPNASAPASTGTKALHASIATRNPVRVLRSGGAGGNARNRNPYLPSCGLRYDGLYRVTLFRQRTNQKRGLYDQFRLERLSDQTPLAVLQRTSPTMDEVIALNRLRGKA